MYAIRCTVTHPHYVRVVSGLYKSNYIILVDTPKLRTAFDVALRAMQDKYHNRYERQNFEISPGAQKVEGNLSGEVFKVLFTN